MILSLKDYWGEAIEDKGVKNKAECLAEAEKVLALGVQVLSLTSLWRRAGQCGEGQIHDIAADDRGL